MKKGLWFCVYRNISPAKSIYTHPGNSSEPSKCKILLQGKSSVCLGVSWQLPVCCLLLLLFYFYQKVVLLKFLVRLGNLEKNV